MYSKPVDCGENTTHRTGIVPNLRFIITRSLNMVKPHYILSNQSCCAISICCDIRADRPLFPYQGRAKTGDSIFFYDLFGG